MAFRRPRVRIPYAPLASSGYQNLFFYCDIMICAADRQSLRDLHQYRILLTVREILDCYLVSLFECMVSRIAEQRLHSLPFLISISNIVVFRDGITRFCISGSAAPCMQFNARNQRICFNSFFFTFFVTTNAQIPPAANAASIIINMISNMLWLLSDLSVPEE